MAALRFGRAPSPIGPIWVAETTVGVAACSRADSPDQLLAGLRRRFPDAEVSIVDFGRLDPGESLAQRLDLRGLPAFDARVYRIVAAIPPGDTLTYGEVAVLAGSPGAARAVGNAMARCPLFPAVPCHRVVRAADGWSGWGGDPITKRRLLEAERRGVRPPAHR